MKTQAGVHYLGFKLKWNHIAVQTHYAVINTLTPQKSNKATLIYMLWCIKIFLFNIVSQSNEQLYKKSQNNTFSLACH